MIEKTYITLFPICRHTHTHTHTHTNLYPHCMYKMVIIKQRYVNRKEYIDKIDTVISVLCTSVV